MYMDEKIKKLYFYELETRALNFENTPDFQADYLPVSETLDQLYSILPHKDCETFYSNIFSMINTAGCISFAHGFRLGLRLALWAMG